MHFNDTAKPSVEGLLVSKGRYGREVMIRLPRLLVAEGAKPVELEVREAAYPREQVWMIEYL